MASAILILIAISAIIPCYENARILGLFGARRKSHFHMSEALMKALAYRGHEVVVVNHFPQSRTVPNYTDIDISGSVPSLLDNVTTEKFSELTGFGTAKHVWETTLTTCKILLSHQKIKALINSSYEFDLVIKDMSGMECFAGFSNSFKAPLVGIMTCVPYPWIHDRVGNPDHPAYIPGYLMPYTNRMNFWQRLTNALFNFVLTIGNHFFNDVPTNALLKEFFGDDVPTVQEILGKTSLILVNSHFSITEPRPTVPGYVEVGGLHIREPKPLPKDIQEFIDGSDHGIIFFSMGSLVQVQSFPPEKIQALLDTFAALPQRVLMKYTGDQLPWTPNNVIIRKWVPQLDILCHPKTKLFISHGGMMGVLESVYCGVPILGIPLFADQELNVNRLAALGMAVKLTFDQLNSPELLGSIRNLTDQRSYSENAKRVSALFKDRPMTPVDTAVYWVEYVIRHRGAPHLRSVAADMPLYQYLLLDVIGFLLLVVIVFIFFSYLVLKTVVRTVIFGIFAVLSVKEKHD